MRSIYLLFLLLMFASFAFADQSSITKTEISANIQSLQNENANSEIQIEENKQIFELKKTALLELSDKMLVLIKGFVILTVDILKLLMIYIEMKLIIFIFLNVIPKLFNSITEGIASGIGGRSNE